MDDTLQKEYDELQDAFTQLDIMHQNTLLELEKYKESHEYGATFEFENGNTVFIPVLGFINNLRLGDNKPISYKLNFNESNMVQWIYSCDIALEKYKKN